jgi:hypothetical protein
MASLRAKLIAVAACVGPLGEAALAGGAFQEASSSETWEMAAIKAACARQPGPPGADAVPNYLQTQVSIESRPSLRAEPPMDVSRNIDFANRGLPNVTDIPDAASPDWPVENFLDRLDKEIGLKLGFAYTVLFQQATNGPGIRHGAAADFDLFAKYFLCDRDGPWESFVAAHGEYRHGYGSITPSELDTQIGAAEATARGFDRENPCFAQFYWQQKTGLDLTGFRVGKVDPKDYVGGSLYTNANLYFLNTAFSSNPTIAYPGNGLGGVAQYGGIVPFVLRAGLTDANGKTTDPGFDTISRGEYFSFAEGVFRSSFENLGNGSLRLSGWHIDARTEANKPAGTGSSVTLEQSLGSALNLFARYGASGGDAAPLRQGASAGIVADGFLDRSKDVWGIGASWGEPSATNSRNEWVFESFWRLQIAPRAQFTVGYQVILPGLSAESTVVGVLELRLRVTI